jgi:coenzyme PQQ synthesis protein D (PqqD)
MAAAAAHTPRQMRGLWVTLTAVATLSLNCSLKVSDDVVFRELDGEGVILNLASGIYFGLDETGTRMWRLIDQHGQLREVLSALCDEYEASSETLERDLMVLVSELTEKGLLAPLEERAG